MIGLQKRLNELDLASGWIYLFYVAAAALDVLVFSVSCFCVGATKCLGLRKERSGYFLVKRVP